MGTIIISSVIIFILLMISIYIRTFVGYKITQYVQGDDLKTSIEKDGFYCKHYSVYMHNVREDTKKEQIKKAKQWIELAKKINKF